MADEPRTSAPPERPDPPFPPSRPGTRTGLALAALCGLTLLFYARLWLPDYVLIRRDAFRCFPLLKQYIADRLRQGELPQWFPYEGLGREFIGLAAGGVFHFFSLLYLPLPPHEAYRVSVLLSCLAAATGAFALGRLLGYSRSGAVMAGLAFVLSGYVVSLSENMQYLYAVCLLPLFCATLELGPARHRGWVVAAALLWASVFLQGDIQTGYYYGFLAVSWTAARARAPLKEAALRLSAVVLFTLLLAAVQLAPAAGVFRDSALRQAGDFEAQALHWSLHPMRLAGLVAAPLYEGPDEEEAARLFFSGVAAGEFLPSGLWAQSIYLGLPVLGLALLGAGRRDLRVLTALAAVTLLLALGKYAGVYRIVYHVLPLWSAFRYPEKLLGLFSFAVAMLAGAGLDRMRNDPQGAGRWLLAVALCAAAAVASSGARLQWLADAAAGAPPDVIERSATAARLAFLYSGAAALAVATVILALKRGRVSVPLAGMLLAAIVALDMGRANFPVYSTGPVEAARFTPGLVDAVRRHAGTAEPGHYRIFTLDESEFLSRERLDPVLSLDGIRSLMSKEFLDVEFNAAYRLESFNWYLSGLSASMIALYQQPWDLPALGRYNVRYLIGRSERFRKEPALAQALVAEVAAFDLALVRNPALIKPRAYISIKPEASLVPVDPLALQRRADYLTGLLDVIETRGTPLPPGSAGGKAKIVSYAPERVEVGVDTPQAAVLVLLDAFADGWTARLEDGTGLPILRANGLVRAVVLPEGRHLVTFTYRTPYLVAGMLLSLLGLLACGLWLVAPCWLPLAGRSCRDGAGALPGLPAGS